VNLWIKWSAQAHKDAVISSLTDTQFRAFITILEVAKGMRKGGEFRDRTHLATVIGPRLGRAIPRLIAEGLLEVSQGGLVTVSNWSRWQVDPTSAQRVAKHRAQNGSEQRYSNALEKSRVEKSREEKTLTNGIGIKSFGVISRGGAR